VIRGILTGRQFDTVMHRRHFICSSMKTYGRRRGCAPFLVLWCAKSNWCALCFKATGRLIKPLRRAAGRTLAMGHSRLIQAFCLLVHVRFAPKADETRHRSEMTRRANKCSRSLGSGLNSGGDKAELLIRNQINNE
jgi:hypothetical protein